uniref:uncharacterized protein LOC118145059 n=1 Tax=Callithrix jacchus TaxID=9483 RepID=UPI00159F6F97|nr:uncharacterized protein LOC118145059 [Callithrix jacchus]
MCKMIKKLVCKGNLIGWGRGGGTRFYPEHNYQKRKRGGVGAQLPNTNRTRAKGGDLRWAGIQEAPPEQVLWRPLPRVTFCVSSPRASWVSARQTCAPRPVPDRLRSHRAESPQAALTPEEALAPSSSSPLQAGDVGLTARSQKAAPSGARSPRSAVETPAQSPGRSGTAATAAADPEAVRDPDGSDVTPTSSGRGSGGGGGGGVASPRNPHSTPLAHSDRPGCRSRQPSSPLGRPVASSPYWWRLPRLEAFLLCCALGRCPVVSVIFVFFLPLFMEHYNGFSLCRPGWSAMV